MNRIIICLTEMRVSVFILKQFACSTFAFFNQSMALFQAQQSGTPWPSGIDTQPERTQHGAVATQQWTESGATGGDGAAHRSRNPDGAPPAVPQLIVSYVGGWTDGGGFSWTSASKLVLHPLSQARVILCPSFLSCRGMRASVILRHPESSIRSTTNNFVLACRLAAFGRF